MYKILFLVLVFIAAPIFAQSSIEIKRDDKGVWFITGPEDAKIHDVYEAVGYCVATDRLFQAEKFRLGARGKLAALFGSDLLDGDIFIRTFGYSEEEMTQAFDELDQEVQNVIQGYVGGFNKRIAEIREDNSLMPFEFITLGLELENWTVSDVLAWVVSLQMNFDPEALDFTQLENGKLLETLAKKHPKNYISMFEDLRWTNDPKAQTYIPGKDTNITTISPVEKDLNLWETIANSNISKSATNLTKMRNNRINSQKKVNAYVKMGSYAWVVSKDRTTTGNPIVYSGPQMGFSTPAICVEGSINAGGIHISGMTVPGIPGIIIGRTPHHAWSMQVGHAHTVDFYLEDPANVQLDRVETIKVLGEQDAQISIYKTPHGPVISPMPYNPATYNPEKDGPIISWKYAHRNYDLKSIQGWLQLAKAKSMDEFAQGIEYMGVSQHFTYADKNGNIAYWMSGRDPLRKPGEYRFPQPIQNPQEWDAAVLRARSTDRNNAQGYYGGWNNKSSVDYGTYNSSRDQYGVFQRTHVIHDYLAAKDKFSFEDIRNLALHIASTDSFQGGGNVWKFVEKDFGAAVKKNSNPKRLAALKMLSDWDGHFVAGDWATGQDRADGWILANKWVDNVTKKIFSDELKDIYQEQRKDILFNVLLHALDKSKDGVQNKYDWFADSETKSPQNIDDIVVEALDETLKQLGKNPWGKGQRGSINFEHEILGKVHSMPRTKRSTYAHIVEMGKDGPQRIESMLPLGQSGTILFKGLEPIFDPHFFTMAPLFDIFEMRKFPLFDK
ncbi:penicillin acylase family protein [Candidatus Uabimicrobium sp. HlEnr_7]|uniref:penicillin acylase family protein n=1 Tax=Candidatus Uabimicrobium helgolandensis TaxID=3095367 RepID=UPI003555C6FC